MDDRPGSSTSTSTGNNGRRTKDEGRGTKDDEAPEWEGHGPGPSLDGGSFSAFLRESGAHSGSPLRAASGKKIEASSVTPGPHPARTGRRLSMLLCLES